MNVRKQDMSQWKCNTRRCSDLESAFNIAYHNYAHLGEVSVLIWPLGGQWLVITYASTLAN